MRFIIVIRYEWRSDKDYNIEIPQVLCLNRKRMKNQYHQHFSFESMRIETILYENVGYCYENYYKSNFPIIFRHRSLAKQFANELHTLGAKLSIGSIRFETSC